MNALANKKGMTLVEVIVGLVVCAIFVTIAIAVISPITESYGRTENRAEAEMIGKNVLETIRGKTGTADVLEVVEQGKGLAYDRQVITVDGSGYLTIGGERAYPASYYNGKTLELVTKQDAPNKIQVLLKVKNKQGTVLAQIDTIVAPIIGGGRNELEEYEQIYKDIAKDMKPWTGRDTLIRLTYEKTGYLVKVDPRILDKTGYAGQVQYWRPYQLSSREVFFFGSAKTYESSPHGGWEAALIYIHEDVYVYKNHGTKRVGSIANASSYATMDAFINGPLMKDNFIKLEN
ncbi:MAG: prepilin-type N-terminal cleavage/methylation domain-containing protein [Anaerovoracaceae bacterium]